MTGGAASRRYSCIEAGLPATPHTASRRLTLALKPRLFSFQALQDGVRT